MRRTLPRLAALAALSIVAAVLPPVSTAAAVTPVAESTDASRFTAGDNWGTSSWNSQKYGDSYRYATPNTTSSDVAWYQFEIPSTDSYAVDVWYPANSGYNNATPYVVKTTSGNQPVIVNQRTNGGQWVRLGEFEIAAGDSNVIGVSRWTSGTGQIIADAVRISTTTTQDIGAYTVFNSPVDSVSDTALEDHLVELVNGAPSGSTIHGAMYSWTRPQMAEALSAAQARGVDVHLAIDGEGSGGVNSDPDNPAQQVLRDANLTELVLCSQGDSSKSACVSNRDGSINHNKVFTFSSTGGMTDVVAVGSANLTSTQTRAFNNFAVVHGDADLYNYFVGYMGDMLAQNRDNNYFNNGGYFRSDTSMVRVFLSPRADSSGGIDAEARSDTMALRLSYIKDYEPGCTVEVAHAQFTGPRLPVAQQLIRIGNLGCDVNIVVNDMTDYIRGKLAGQTNVTIRTLDNLHSKYITYTGNYNSLPDRAMVFTGSHNLTGPALRKHDETMIRVERDAIVQDYRTNFADLWQLAS